jgi:glycosyltransferase involved in cell wall biosynthesis
MSARPSGPSDANRLSILAVTSEVPWPLDSGGHLRTFHLLRAFAARHDVEIVAPSPHARDAAITASLRDAGMQPHLVPIDGTRGGRALWAIARTALSRQPYVMYRRHDHRAVRLALRARIAARPPDVLYLDHLDSFVYADEARGAMVVGDMHNVYSLLASRAARSQRHWVTRRYVNREARLLAGVEARAASTADLVTTVSDAEQRYFQGLTERPVGVVPNGVDVARYATGAIAPRPDPPVVLYLGAMSWQPNVDAARFLVTEMLPVLRRRVPDVRIQIVGRDPSEEVRALAGTPGVEVTGAVPDVVPYLAAARVLAVPLEAGGGTRLKILEAFAAGLPVVSTPVGCEGIDVDPETHLVVASRADFGGATADLLLAPARAEAMAGRARAFVAGRYDWDVIGEAANDLIARTVRARRSPLQGEAAQ